MPGSWKDWKDWMISQWRAMLGEHDESMTSHAPRMDPVDVKIQNLEDRSDPVDLKIAELERRTSEVERVLALYEAERNSITYHKRIRRERHR